MKASSVYAVEVSGACNLTETCTWCPMYTKGRKRGFMDESTVERALQYVIKLPPDRVLHLQGFGEPLLHPKFTQIAHKFSKITPISFSTNATYLDEHMADKLRLIPWEWISLSPWDPPSVDRAIPLLKERNIKFVVTEGVLHDWAGQAKGRHIAREKGCHFLSAGEIVIRWNGDLASCCISDREEDKIGHITQDPDTVFNRQYDICAKCHHHVG